MEVGAGPVQGLPGLARGPSPDQSLDQGPGPVQSPALGSLDPGPQVDRGPEVALSGREVDQLGQGLGQPSRAAALGQAQAVQQGLGQGQEAQRDQGLGVQPSRDQGVLQNPGLGAQPGRGLGVLQDPDQAQRVLDLPEAVESFFCARNPNQVMHTFVSI